MDFCPHCGDYTYEKHSRLGWRCLSKGCSAIDGKEKYTGRIYPTPELNNDNYINVISTQEVRRSLHKR